MGVLQQLGSVIDVAEKTIEFRNFRNVQVPIEVVAGHLTMDLPPKHASAHQSQLTPPMWDQARQGQEATILRPSSENIGWDASSLTQPVAMTATPPKDSDCHQTDAAHGQTDVSSGHFSSLKFAEPFDILSFLAISCWRIVARSEVETSSGRCTDTQNAL